jgi:hypothetical protein
MVLIRITSLSRSRIITALFSTPRDGKWCVLTAVYEGTGQGELSWKNESIVYVERIIHDLLRENLSCWLFVGVLLGLISPPLKAGHKRRDLICKKLLKYEI